MFKFKRKQVRPVVTYDQQDLDRELDKMYKEQVEAAIRSASRSLEYQNTELDARYKLMRERKKTFAVKMVDAIARGNVESLLNEWDDPYHPDWEKSK